MYSIFKAIEKILKEVIKQIDLPNISLKFDKTK